MTQSPLKAALLARDQKKVPLKRNGEPMVLDGVQVEITVRKISAADLVKQGGEMLSAYGALTGIKGLVKPTTDEAQAYALTRAVILAGVVDPPLDGEAGPDKLTPEDLDIENWGVIFEAIAEVSDLGLLFRRILEAQGRVTEAVRPRAEPANRRRRRRR